ncbi:MAG: hypothetical protein AB1512_06925 [Thermodesulfobacteriota bacterium]
MISTCCDLYEFVEAVQERNYFEVIYLAEQEATEAERLRFRQKGAERQDPDGCPRYADSLKGFISYMRYGIRTSHVDKKDIQRFRSLRDRLIDIEFSGENDPSRPEC